MRSKLLAFSEWLMIFPAILFLTVTVVRFLQPRQYEPAHTSWVISEWITGHASRAGAAVVFVALPSVVAILGCALFGETWKRDSEFRRDMETGLVILRRQAMAVFSMTAVLLAGAIIALVIAHVITD